ncbi:MAG: class I SAM-dependent methyltransferase [Frankia sp.]|nr:class I SAM-dependent methyltransferase [Frankia sp.]
MTVWFWLPVVIAISLLLNGLRLRGRLRRLDTLPASGRPVDPDHLFICAEGVQLTDAARRAASYHASRERLDVLDLVPADLTIERALDVARMVDTRTYRNDRMAAGRGAFQALLVRAEVARRAGVEIRDDYTAVELVEVTERLKRYAPGSTDLAVLPGLRAARDDAASRARVQKRAWEETRPLRLVLPTLRDLAIGLSFHENRPWGFAAMALFWCQPFFVCLGRVPVAPRDLIRAPIVRLLSGPLFALDAVRTWRRETKAAAAAKAAGRAPDPVKERKKAEAAQRRDRYQHEFAAGPERYLQPPRPDCPWCGSYDLAIRLITKDLEQRKPGRFQLDECQECGHIFQNPRLSLTGTAIYERDRRDGINAEQYEAAQANNAALLRARAEIVRPFVLPRTWLDVGTGLGHFCNAARSVWPRTVFDGVGPDRTISEAERRGWVDTAYRGRFTDHAARVAGLYDVISMFNYLERSRDPSAELDGVAKALGPGGFLVAELPNPHGLGARWLGRLWRGWAVPAAKQLIPVDNLVAALEDRGLRTVLVQIGPAHQPGDLLSAVGMAIQAIAPSPTQPWSEERAVAVRWLWRALVLLAAIGPAILAGIVGAVAAGFMRTDSRSNTYRIVARKEG